MNNFLKNYYKGINKPFFILTLIVSAIPFLSHILGFDIYFNNKIINLSDLNTVNEIANERTLNGLLVGKYIHTLIVGFSITIAFLTTILSFVDYFIKKNVSTPIVGVALLCAAMLDLVHILSADQLIYYEEINSDIASFTWLFSRIFHALILILGVGIFLLQKKESVQFEYKSEKYFVMFITSIFILLAVNAILIVTDQSLIVPKMNFSNSFTSHPYDLIPLLLYIISGLIIFPKFYKLYPNTFSQTLILSLIPSIAAQLHMAFGSKEIYDFDFFAAQFLKTISYFVPFVGLAINYVETYIHEKIVVEKLDVEYKKRSEAQVLLQGILDVSLSGIMSFSVVKNEKNEVVDFIWQTINPAAERLSIVKKDEIIGKSLLKSLSNTEDLFLRYKKVYETGISMSFERFVARTDRQFHIIATKLNDGIAITFDDITELKRGQEAILNSQKIQATHKFARVITHEIKNPLTNISLAVEQLKLEEKFPEDLQMYLEILSRNSGRINQLITDVMNASKMTDLQISSISSNDLINESLLLINDRIQLENIKVIFNKMERVDLRLDVSKMKIALLNIFLNAVEAMTNRSGVLTINAFKNLNQYIIQITDNGIGMNDDQLNNIFEPFFSSKSKGFGIGLTASQTIIFNHGGNIDVRSELNKGTTFIINIPL